MIKLRRFGLSDLEKIQTIDKVSFPNRRSYSRTYLEKLFQKYPEGFIVAEAENEAVGYTIGRPPKQSLRDATGQVKNGRAEIVSLAVKPDFRQRGIGRELTNFLINHFKKMGIKEIFLRVRTENKIGIDFYQKLGFEVLKTIKNYYQNGEDAYLMKKKLGG